MSIKTINDWRGKVKQDMVKPGLTIEYILEPSKSVLDLRANPPDLTGKAEQIADVDTVTSFAALRDFLKRERGLI